ncbi:MAG: reverse transcriptase domain-containing protein [Acetobacteraceae bacterium]
MASTALDRLISVANLREVWKEYKPRAAGSAAGIDGVTPRQFDDNLTQWIARIQEEVRKGYVFSALRGVSVPKKDPTKFRIICVPTIKDRVVQRALLRAIEGKATRLRIANDVSFGFVKDTPGTKRGAAAARAVAIRHRQAKPWAFKADIASFFDRIDRQALIVSFRKSFQLRSLTSLVSAAVACEVDDHDPRIRRVLSESGIKRGEGLRQGMPLSPILSNFLLRDFDRAFITAGYDLVRYADDLIILASTPEESADAEVLTRTELLKLGLGLSEQKTEIRTPAEPVEFLGMELAPKPGTPRYCLTISKQQQTKIREQFTKFHDVDLVMKEDLNLPKLLQRLENMKSGYRTAYQAADNFRMLSAQLDQWAGNCITKVYTSMFSAKSVQELTRTQRRFLLLPQV